MPSLHETLMRSFAHPVIRAQHGDAVGYQEPGTDERVVTAICVGPIGGGQRADDTDVSQVVTGTVTLSKADAPAATTGATFAVPPGNTQRFNVSDLTDNRDGSVTFTVYRRRVQQR